MDNNKPASESQGSCFESCDKAYGKGFGEGKGWNRFWCKASCFKINVNVGGASKDDNPDKLTQKPKTSNASLLLPAVQKVRGAASRSDSKKGSKRGNVEYSWKVEKGEK